MSPEYRSYLAAGILNEERVITYRLLSRALKVHVNTAKQMLFEFHRQQNGKKPGTVHATYLVSGTKRKPAPATTNGNGATLKDGEDEYMQSSPFRSSPVPNPEEFPEDFQVLSLTLVREENLDEVQSMYQMIASIHIYSLAPSQLKDLQVLSDTARETAEVQVNQDPFEVAGTYGTIINKAAKRRIGRQAPPSAVQLHAEAAHLLSQPGDAKEGTGTFAPKIKPEPKASQSSKEILRKSSQEKRNASPNPPHLKRDSSNIFQSFAKAKPPLRRERTDSSAGASGLESSLPTDLEDEAMKDTSEGEEDDYIPIPTMSSKEPADPDKNFRKRREAALKRMMEEDDENEDANVAQLQQRPGSAKDSPVTEPAEPPEEAVQVSGGRRRGRKRVMKKKTAKDEEGYLVTREEATWESFSEEESVKSKAKPSSSVPSSSDKSKKGSAKAGQGSIMSFFGKK